MTVNDRLHSVYSNGLSCAYGLVMHMLIVKRSYTNITDLLVGFD